MPQAKISKKSEPMVLVGKNNGITVIPSPTPLTRLHYFDGKFLRARDLELEQNYLRQLVALSNQAGGAGVVHGFDCDLSGNSLELGPGLAIDGQGRVLLLPESRSFDLAALIEASRQRYASSLPQPIAFPGGFSPCCSAVADEPGAVSEGATFYLLSICHAEALCGEEDVFGKLCAAACTTTTERPYTLEGLVLRALPLDFSSLLPSSAASPVPIGGQQHLRSRAAAAFFEDERQRGGSLISEGGLKSPKWCHGAAADATGCVPLAVIARAGSQTLFLDSWIARRERIETPPRRYWAGILAMRPWDVYLAQVLQFQCQLAGCLARHAGESGDDPCRETHELLRQTAEQLAVLIRSVSPDNGLAGGPDRKLDYQHLEKIRGRLADAGNLAIRLPRERRLLHCCFVELPSAGYLPVDPAARETVNQQVRAMLGDSVDLRFCVVRPDFVPHAFEEAQHMERISLLYGYDHPDDQPKVDVLVPNGLIEEKAGKLPGAVYTIDSELSSKLVELLVSASNWAQSQTFPAFRLLGAGRGEKKDSGAIAFHAAVRGSAAQANTPIFTGDALRAGASQLAVTTGSLWYSGELAQDPFELESGGLTSLNAEIVFAQVDGDQVITATTKILLELKVASRTQSGDTTRLGLRLSGTLANVVKVDGNDKVNRVDTIKQSLIVDRKAGAFGTTHQLILRQVEMGRGQTVDLLASRAWPEAGLAIVESLSKDNSGIELNLFKAAQKLDAAASQPGQAAHDGAITALEQLGLRLQDPDFADSRARRLFPPATGESATELIVRARLPWVLFHRRRDKICAQAAAAAKPVPTRRFRVYHVELSRREEVHILLRELKIGRSLANFNPQFVATVEFAAGLAALQGELEPLETSWDAACPDGDGLVFGALAGQGEVLNEGEVLARTRLSGLAGVLGSVTPVQPQAEFELLDSIHPDLPANGLDGAIVYATTKGTTVVALPKKICQSLFVLKFPTVESSFQELAKAIGNQGFDATVGPGVATNRRASALSPLLYLDPTAKPFDGNFNAAIAEVKAAFPNIDPRQFILLTISPKEATAADLAIHGKRTKSFMAELGGQNLLEGVRNGGDKPLPGTCPAITLLAFLG